MLGAPRHRGAAAAASRHGRAGQADRATRLHHCRLRGIVLRMFKWDVKTQSPDAIESLEPFHTVELAKPV
jgi:hypothetical protein